MNGEVAKLTIDYLKSIQQGCVEVNGSDMYPSPEWYALDVAIELVEQARWIPVSERLPENEEEVLMDTAHFGVITGVYDSKRGFLTHYSLSSKDLASVEVIAWKPSPESCKTDMGGEE